MRGDELGNGGEVDFFCLGFGDDDVRIRGVSSSFASEFEYRVWCFIFVWCSVQGSPAALVLGSFFVKDTESVSGGCWSFKYKLVFLRVGTPPL